MAKALKQQKTTTRGRKPKAGLSRGKAMPVTPDEYDPGTDTPESEDLDAIWFSAPVEANERSRVQRQVKARRELERRREEKRLKELVEDWYYDDEP